MNEVKRFQWDPIGMRDVERVGFYRSSTWVDASDYDAKAAECNEVRAELARAIAWKEDAILRCAKRRCADRDRIQRETEAENERLLSENVRLIDK